MNYNNNMTDKERIREEEKKKETLMILFALEILLMSIAYGTLTRKLISTTPTTSTGIWNVAYSSIKTTKIVGDAYNLTNPTVYNTSAFVNAGFSQEGDSITYTIVVNNYGTLNARLDSIHLYNINNETFEYVVEGIEVGDVLVSGKSKEFTLTIKVLDTDIDVKKDFYLNLNYVQD